jgi:hypothetical protein
LTCAAFDVGQTAAVHCDEWVVDDAATDDVDAIDGDDADAAEAANVAVEGVRSSNIVYRCRIACFPM